VTTTNGVVNVTPVTKTNYAYIMDWDDYYAPAALHYMQSKGLKVASAFKPFSANTNAGNKKFNYGSIMVPVSKQEKDAEEVFTIVKEAQLRFKVPVYATNTGFSTSGVDLGSRNLQYIEQPKAAMIIGDGVNSYEAGEVWHLLDTRIGMPITKIQSNRLSRISLDDYNTLVMVSNWGSAVDSMQQKKIKDWVSKGNTLITIAGASRWAIQKKLVKEKFTEKEKDTAKGKEVERLPYVDAGEINGAKQVGGAIFEVDLDITHPLGFGYRDSKVPVYKNNTVFIAPSKSAYGTVAKYTENAHIDGYISEDNYENLLKPSASVVVSSIGGGRVILFADNPNFRGAWYGTNRMFLNAVFLGGEIRAPE